MHVLLAIDTSPESMKAVDALVRIPFRDECKLTIVTALRESTLDLRTDANGVAIYEAERKLAEEQVSKARDRLQTRFRNIETIVCFRHPNELILDVARERDVDLIVLAARGHNFAYRALVGSTAEYVANHAKCSVLIARGEIDAVTGDHLLLPYDGSSHSEEAARQLAALDWPKGTTTHVAMILERPRQLIEIDPIENQSELHANRILAGLNLGPAAGTVSKKLSEARDAGVAINDAAQNHNIRMIFVGATGKSAVSRFFLGSVSRHLLHVANCSIWIARRKQWSKQQSNVA